MGGYVPDINRIRSPMFPVGCQISLDRQVFLNVHAAGSAHGERFPICEVAGIFFTPVAGNNTCPRGYVTVDSLDTCVEAVAQLAVEVLSHDDAHYVELEVDSRYPRGCYIAMHSESQQMKVYLNHHAKGGTW